MEQAKLAVIARIYNDFPTKFGLPRQSGLAKNLLSTIVFEPTYRVAEAFRGLQDFSHLWLIWGFSESEHENWSPTVRPPKLGGNVRMGVFATRSPNRPNSIGLSAVKLEKIYIDDVKGICLVVSGADLMNGTPIYDVKPYLPFVDSIPNASAGIYEQRKDDRITVVISEGLASILPPDKLETLRDILSNDPRPAYQNDPTRRYGFLYAGYEIGFVVEGSVLTVKSIEKV